MTAFEKVKYGAFFPSEGKKISQKEEGKNMAVKWTAEQQKVIDARDRNLLVSAAAGSGKTAVLVERILAMVKDPVHPIDIDQLLVVTFTRAGGRRNERENRPRSAAEPCGKPGK